MNGDVGWFPQDFAHLFFMFKGCFALLVCVMVVIHTHRVWEQLKRTGSIGQRLRYIALTCWVILVASSACEQVHENLRVSYRNLGAIVVLIVTMVAMVVSIREDRKRKENDASSHS